MLKSKKNAFTLIELVGVLVIMAIIALIATPLVMNIIRKARISADKRSIDAYGRSIELAIAGYLLDNGKFPTEVSQLTIEYSGNQVVCTTTQINTDSSVYLAGCTVAGRNVGDYTYGSDKSPSYTAYTVGDEVTYNNVDYYVIKDSAASEDSVTLLKAEPLSVEEVNIYGGVGTENNHVNLYGSNDTSSSYYQKASNKNGYGGMAYYTSDTCTNWGITAGCITSYENSEIKYVVDAWAEDKTKVRDLKEVRLLKSDDFKNLGYEWGHTTTSDDFWVKTNDVPSWVYDTNYWYWSMISKDENNVWGVGNKGCYMCDNYYADVRFGDGAVRPVIVLSKSAL